MDKCEKSYIEWVNNVPLFYCTTSKEMCPYGRYCTNELIPKMGGNYVGCVELNRVIVEAVEEVIEPAAKLVNKKVKEDVE